MGYTFGKKSKEKLATCHPDLQKILQMAITRSKVDFGISEGRRDLDRQWKLFQEGKTKIDGVSSKGKHNYDPSLAADLYAYHPDKETRVRIIYDEKHLSYIAGVIDACAAELYEKGEITHLVRWGGNWDGDGVIGLDQTFWDLPHHELLPA